MRLRTAIIAGVALTIGATMFLVPALQAQAGSTAIQAACTAPAWAEGNTYTVGTQVTYQGHTYQALQTHTAYPGTGWTPPTTPALWTDLGPCTGGGGPTTPPPTTPSGVPSVPGNLRVTSTTNTSISLAWNASTDDVGVAGYDVFRNGGTKLGSATGTTTTIGGLTANTDYVLTVRARDAAGNVSAASNQITVHTGSSCTQPVCDTRQITTSTDIPWGLAFLPDGSGLYTERDSFNVTRVTPSGQKTTVGTVPNVSGTDGEGGLLGLELSPSFASDHWVYIFHTTSSDNRIVRIRLENNALVTSSEQVLLTGIARNKFHDGGRLRFGPDGRLYASTGDAQNTNNAQNRGSLNGKVLRLNPDGSAPSDNPFFSMGGNARYVWSFGHRNVQGLAFDSQGRLWEAELGNSTMDELNLIQKGGNYGWPSCEGTSGDCSGFIAPKRTWSVSSASPSGLAIVNDTLFMAALRGERLWVMRISGSGTTTPQVFFQGTFGRLRTVEPSPDGGLWLTTSNGDKDSTPNNSSTRIIHVALP